MKIAIGDHIGDLFTKYMSVLDDPKLRARMKPDPQLWLLFLDVLFGVAGVAAGRVAKLFKPVVSRTGGQSLPVKMNNMIVTNMTVSLPGNSSSVPSAAATNAANAVKVLTTPAKNHTKSFVKRHAKELGRENFFDMLGDELSVVSGEMQERIHTDFDDAQLTALKAYYQPANHTRARIRVELERILDTYVTDVEKLGRHHTVAVIIEGPNRQHQRRLAICRRYVASNPFVGGAQSAEGALDAFYVFDHWVHDGYEDLVARRQRGIDQEQAVRGLPAPAAGPTVIRSSSPGLRDPKGEVKAWTEATVPRFVPGTYGPDGKHDPGGIEIPRASSPVNPRSEGEQ